MWKLPTVEETAGFKEGLVLITCWPWIWDRSLNFSELLLLNPQNESKDSNSTLLIRRDNGEEPME